MKIKHAAIVPLIGGETIAQMKSFGFKPDYLLSYSPFSSNDSHLINYLGDIDYITLDTGGVHPHTVDVVSSVCPCAGLSSLSTSSNADSAVNDWLYKTTEYVLSSVRPKVLFGENAPRFGSEGGRPVVNKMLEIALKNGYTMSIYRTKSLLHGLPQVRERSFFFFWRGTKIPVLNWFNRPYIKYEDLIRSVSPTLTQSEVVNKNIPSKDDPFYRYILEEMHSGITHQEFFSMIPKTVDVMSYIEKNGISYKEVKPWMESNGYIKIASKLDAIQDKLDSGKNIMRRMSVIDKDYTGAFVGHLPFMLTHPDIDRYLTYRECMTIMGLPDDFELLSPKKNLNHICQNVPVSTAKDMADEVKAFLNNERELIDGKLFYQFNGNKTTRLECLEEKPELSNFMV